MIAARFFKVQRRAWIAIFTMLFCAAISHAAIIQNDVFWKDESGNLICSQGGGMLKVGGTYYWYGVNYEGATTYAADPSPSNKGAVKFKSVKCYSSTDLGHWKPEGDVLSQNQTGGGWFGRMGVVYNATTRKYVLLAQGSSPEHMFGEYFATSDLPTGPFTYHHVQSDLPGIANGGTGDQTTFQDDDGKAYLICSNKNGRSHLYVAQLRDSDFLAIETAKQVFHGDGREGNCMFKYQGRYYFCSSNLHGWNASPAYVISASNIMGPYGPETVMRNTELDFSHVTQTGFFFTVNGSKQTTVIFAGDRWSDFGGNGIGYNQWCPLSFDGTTPVFHSLSQWNLDAMTGEWSAGPHNNYVLNPSFEADRVSQRALAGWVGSGGGANGNDKDAPHSGKFCMNQQSSTDYTASISQTINGLPNGTYTLSAWVKSSGGQKSAVLAAKDFGGSDLTYSLAKSMSKWTLVSISGINVTNGTCQVAIISDAKANNWVRVDDVSLVKSSTLGSEAAALSTPRPITPPPLPPTPHLTTVAEAQQEAVRRFPALGVLGSPFNASFVALYNRYQQERPAFFTDPSWPLQLAQEIAARSNPSPIGSGTH